MTIGGRTDPGQGTTRFVDPMITSNKEAYMPTNASDTAIDPMKNTDVGKNTGDANSTDTKNHG